MMRVLVCLALLCGSCAGPVSEPVEMDRAAAERLSDCLTLAERLEVLSASIEGSFELSAERITTPAAKVRVGSSQARMRRLGRLYDLSGLRACQTPVDSGLMGCMRRRLEVFYGLDAVLQAPFESPEASDLMVGVEIGLEGLVKTLGCEGVFVALPEGGLALGSERRPGPAGIEGKMLCRQRRGEGHFEAMSPCHGAVLKVGDEVKFAFKLDRDAFVYVFGATTEGRYEVIFPRPDDDNLLFGKTSYELPAENWGGLTPPGGALQRYVVVAAAGRVSSLEALRGLLTTRAPAADKGRALLALERGLWSASVKAQAGSAVRSEGERAAALGFEVLLVE